MTDGTPSTAVSAISVTDDGITSEVSEVQFLKLSLSILFTVPGSTTSCTSVFDTNSLPTDTTGSPSKVSERRETMVSTVNFDA